MQQTEERTGVSRRRVVAGVAWSVPAIVAASALPAYAASNTVTTVSVGTITRATGPGKKIINIPLKLTTSDNSVVKAGTVGWYKVTLTSRMGKDLKVSWNDTGNGQYTEKAYTSTGAVTAVNSVDMNGVKDTQLTYTFYVKVTMVTDNNSPFTTTLVIEGDKPQDVLSVEVTPLAASQAAPGNGTIQLTLPGITGP